MHDGRQIDRASFSFGNDFLCKDKNVVILKSYLAFLKSADNNIRQVVTMADEWNSRERGEAEHQVYLHTKWMVQIVAMHP